MKQHPNTKEIVEVITDITHLLNELTTHLTEQDNKDTPTEVADKFINQLKHDKDNHTIIITPQTTALDLLSQLMEIFDGQFDIADKYTFKIQDTKPLNTTNTNTTFTYFIG